MPPPTTLETLLSAEIDERIVGIAVGILVARRGCTPHRALGMLVDLATRTDRSVIEVARRLVDRQTRRGPRPLIGSAPGPDRPDDPT